MNTFLIPANLVSAQFVLAPEVPDLWLPLAIAAWLGAVMGTFPFEREIFPRFDFGRWLLHVCSAWALRLGIWFVYIGCALIMPEEFGWPVLAIAGAALLFHLWLLWGLRVKLLCWIRLLRPADDRLRRIVTETASRMGVRIRGVWTLAGIYAQAYALPTTRELLFSERLLEICDDKEVSAVCAHELGHLTESKTTLCRRVAGTFAFFPFLFIKPAFHADNPFALLLLVIPLLMLLFVKGLSIRMEKRADQVATDAQTDPGVYGRALEKLYRENLIPAANAGNRRTHPHLYDRLLAAGITPDFPKPPPPKRQCWTSYLLLSGLLVTPILVGIVKAVLSAANVVIININ
jgi:Zn-dependent protease with chaperone function